MAHIPHVAGFDENVEQIHLRKPKNLATFQQNQYVNPLLPSPQQQQQQHYHHQQQQQQQQFYDHQQQQQQNFHLRQDGGFSSTVASSMSKLNINAVEFTPKNSSSSYQKDEPFFRNNINYNNKSHQPQQQQQQQSFSSSSHHKSSLADRLNVDHRNSSSIPGTTINSYQNHHQHHNQQLHHHPPPPPPSHHNQHNYQQNPRDRMLSGPTSSSTTAASSQTSSNYFNRDKSRNSSSYNYNNDYNQPGSGSGSFHHHQQHHSHHQEDALKSSSSSSSGTAFNSYSHNSSNNLFNREKSSSSKPNFSYNNDYNQSSASYHHLQKAAEDKTFFANNSRYQNSVQNSSAPHNASHQQQQHQHQQHHHSSSSNNAEAASSSSTSEEEEIAALNYLQEVIQILNENPGEFDCISKQFLSMFDGLQEREYVMCNAMEDIFKMSLETPNFRYMGAKLYHLLHSLNPTNDSFFLTLLRLKLEDHQQEMQSSHQDNVQRETALFLAELYMQLRVEGRILLIAQNIVFTLKQLLKKVSDENIRCVCLSLKLAGYDLCMDCPEEMKQVIQILEHLESSQPGKYPILGNVLNLQKNNWGRKISLTPDNLSENDFAQPFSNKNSDPELPYLNEPVFYGPDGAEITAEEVQFMTAGLPDEDEEEDDLVPEDDDFGPYMDDEADAAYKEFLKMNNQS